MENIKKFETYSSTIISDRDNGKVEQHLKFIDRLYIYDTTILDEAMMYSLSDKHLEKIYRMCVIEMMERGL